MERHEPKPAPKSVDSLPAGPVSGKIDGQSFALGNARYSIDTRPHYEKVDIMLTADKLEDPCAALGASHATSVWLRRAGKEPLKEETVRIGPKDKGAWEAHYDAFKDDRWEGNGDAAALLYLHDVAVDRRLRGEISVCFGDEAGSCVAGSFSAQYCPIRIDQPVRGSSALEPLPTDKVGSIPPPEQDSPVAAASSAAPAASNSAPAAVPAASAQP